METKETASREERGSQRSLRKSVHEPLRRTLSPIASAGISAGGSAAGLVVRGATPLARSISKRIAPRRLSDSANDPSYDDYARPAQMAKSFVSILTTASMYSGNVTDLATEDLMALRENTIEHDDGHEPLDYEPGEHSQSQTDETDKESVADSQLSAESAPPIQGSIFELSMERKLSLKGSTEDLKSRAVTICQKLAEKFDVKEDDTFIDEYSCWLLKDVLLQGHIYLTKSYLLFLAILPKTSLERSTLSGSLAMETLPSRLSRYWAVLKNHTLTFYPKSTDLYFPSLTIDLRNAIKAQIIPDSKAPPDAAEKDTSWFKVITETRTYKFQADSPNNARSWVGRLKKQIFTIRNNGDCVTVKIPLQNIIDAEETPIFEPAETIRLHVLESGQSFAYDDYFFMFFKSGPEAFKAITHAADEVKQTEEGATPALLSDSTVKLDVQQKTRSFNPLKHVFRSHNGEFSAPGSPASRSLQNVAEVPNSPSMPILSRSTSSFTNEQTVAQIIPASQQDDDNIEEIPDDILSDDEPDESISDDVASASSKNHRFNPLRPVNHARNTISRWTPQFIKSASSMWNANIVHYAEKNSLERGSEDDEFLATNAETVRMTKRFQIHFSLADSDHLIATYYCYLHRNIPMYGKVYLGEKEICYRGLVPGFHTKMILPYSDIENCYKEKGFKFGYFGLVVVIQGHEELFLEFSSSSARDDCEYLLLKQLESSPSDSSSQAEQGESQLSSSKKLEASKIKFIEDKIHSEAGLHIPIIIEDHPLVTTKLKPTKSHKITLMTIGSRGDVQPYIALGLGLKAEGHEVTIATHAEFGDWIKKHGLRFVEIAGNPTELMSLMVTHGSMNVGFMREASSKFRGWITELLKTSWEACQGTELLIESPSAMAGVHIAEALGIPYMRAFTMPWTRTRAYPHAFIVPDEKRGGSYNYLTHVLFENVFWRGISGQINKWRQETLKLPKTNLDLLEQNKIPFMYNVSPTVLPPPVDFNDWVKVTGYWFLDEAVTYDPPKALLDFMQKARDDGKKLVYIGFGSIVVSNPKELTQSVVDAVVKADVRCILNKGWSERLGGSSSVEVELPDEIYNSGSLPHDWLFPQIDAAVHHGGSGTTGATLRAGLPTIIKPFFGDQFFYANRVEDIGAGIGLRKLNVKTLSKALKDATTDQRMISKAKAIGERIRKENGVQDAINVIYRDVEYAKALIMKKRESWPTNNATVEHKDPAEEEMETEKLLSRMMTASASSDSALSGNASWLVL